MNENSSVNPDESAREDDTVIDPGNTSDHSDSTNDHSTKEHSTMNEHETTTPQDKSPQTTRSWSTRTVAVGGVVAVLLGLGAGAAIGATTAGDDEGDFRPGISRGYDGPGPMGQGPGGDGRGQMGDGPQGQWQDGEGPGQDSQQMPDGDGRGFGDFRDGGPCDGGPDEDGQQTDKSAA